MKLKTHRGVSKRFRKTGSGKISRRKAGKSHLLTGKPSKRMRELRKSAIVDPSQEKHLKRLLPYD